MIFEDFKRGQFEFLLNLIVFSNNNNYQTAQKCRIHTSYNNSKAIYRKIPNISPGRRDIYKHILGGLFSEGLIFRGLVFRAHFVLVSAYQDFKKISLYDIDV